MIRICVPATSANVGAGFDSVGIALTLYNIFEIECISDTYKFIDVDSRFSNKDHVLIQSFNLTYQRFSTTKHPFLSIKCMTSIPIANGLGSSSTCIIAGVSAPFTF